jgi:hypothetical protein
MGGWGSGRPRERYSVEECGVLDVRDLNRRGDLPKPPQDETWVLVQPRGRADWQRQYIKIERVPGQFRFGGSRPYFRCWTCDRRAEKLYQLGGRGFYRCRRCLNLAYPCQREDACGRAYRRLGKIKARLGADYAAPFPPKPKNMWSSSYLRLWHQYLEAEARADAAFDMQAEAILRRG